MVEDSVIMDEMDAASPSSAQPTTEQEHQRRLRVLSQLAQSQVAEQPPDADARVLPPSSSRAPAKRRWAVVAALALVLVLVGGGAGYALTQRTAMPTITPAPPVVSLDLAPSGA